MKTGPFAEHSNQLWNISAVPNWSKVNQGLIRMYKAEVSNAHDYACVPSATTKSLVPTATNWTMIQFPIITQPHTKYPQPTSHAYAWLPVATIRSCAQFSIKAIQVYA